MTLSDAIDATPPRRHRVTTEEHRVLDSARTASNRKKSTHVIAMDTSRIDGVKAT